MPRVRDDLNIKERFYYVRDQQNRPIVTVCLGTDENGVHSRGVAYCSDKDIPKKSTGRAIARGRMLKAFYHQGESPDRVNPDRVKGAPIIFFEKSEFDCALTTRERFGKNTLTNAGSVYENLRYQHEIS